MAIKKITTITLDPEVREKVKVILKAEGKKMSSVIELFLRKIILENKQKTKGEIGD